MQTISSGPEPGLRERKKAQTRVCAAVPVSHRTFFNYFDSKEDALFGFPHSWGDTELVAEHLQRTFTGSIVECVVTALVHGLPTSADPGLHEARMVIASRNPGLIPGRMQRLADVRTGLIAAIADLMLGEGLVDAHGPVPAEAQAELVVVACIGSIRIALREWADAGALDTPRAIAARATAIARTLAPLAG